MANHNQVNSVFNDAIALTRRLREAEDIARRMTEGWDTLALGSYVDDAANSEAGYLVGVSNGGVSAENMHAVILLASKLQAFLRGGMDDSAKARFYQTIARFERLAV